MDRLLLNAFTQMIVVNFFSKCYSAEWYALRYFGLSFEQGWLKTSAKYSIIPIPPLTIVCMLNRTEDLFTCIETKNEEALNICSLWCIQNRKSYHKGALFWQNMMSGLGRCCWIDQMINQSGLRNKSIVHLKITTLLAAEIKGYVIVIIRRF